jgi:hypothetical protein
LQVYRGIHFVVPVRLFRSTLPVEEAIEYFVIKAPIVIVSLHLLLTLPSQHPLIMPVDFPTPIRDLFFSSGEMSRKEWNSFCRVMASPHTMEIVIDVDYVLLHSSASTEYGGVCPSMLQLLEKIHNLNIPLYAITSLSKIELDTVCDGMSSVFTRQLKASNAMTKFFKLRAHYRELHRNGKAMLLFAGDELADLSFECIGFRRDHLCAINYKYQRETLMENVLTVAAMYAEYYPPPSKY